MSDNEFVYAPEIALITDEAIQPIQDIKERFQGIVEARRDIGRRLANERRATKLFKLNNIKKVEKLRKACYNDARISIEAMNAGKGRGEKPTVDAINAMADSDKAVLQLDKDLFENEQKLIDLEATVDSIEGDIEALSYAYSLVNKAYEDMMQLRQYESGGKNLPE